VTQKNTRKRLLKPFDIPVIVLTAGLTVLIALRVYSQGSNSLNVVVKGPDKTWIFPLEANERVSVAGSIGETLVEIRRGRAAIVASPCNGQTCVAAGELNKNGQWAACLPNRVFILIEGAGAADAVDAASW
jgi:hypothetical protein